MGGGGEHLDSPCTPQLFTPAWAIQARALNQGAEGSDGAPQNPASSGHNHGFS